MRRLFSGCPLAARVNVVLLHDPARLEDLRVFLKRGGFALDSRPNMLLFAERPGVNVAAYRTGKLLLTGAQAQEYALVLTTGGYATSEPAAPEPPHLRGFEPHAGSDESGKGDYFGPLCVAAVHVPDEATARALLQKGVRDSKLLTDADVGPLSALVRHRCPHAVLALAPPRYNDLYERIHNLNDLLAWAHASVLEDLLGQVGAVPVLVDQFARPEVLERHLKDKGRATRVTQAVRGESDVAVAAASILARAEFLGGLAALEVQHGVRLPKGAGAPVVKAAREIGARGGITMLRQVAKVHFATTRGALGL